LKESEIKLSLCIPTYNRPRQFRRLVNHILRQTRINEIEVVIRDDSPNETTQEIVNELLIASGIPTRYFHGEKIGLDAANIFLVENATGQFVWWFSDDEEMREGAIDHVLTLIDGDKDLKYIWANFDFGMNGNHAQPTTCKYFKSGDQAIVELGTHIGLLSTHIFHRATALQAVELANKNLMGFAFAGLVLIFHVITTKGNYYLLGTSYVLNNPTGIDEFKEIIVRNGKIENTAFDVYGIHFRQVLMLYRGKFSDKAIRKTLSINFGSLWRGMLVGWVGGWDTPKGKRMRMLKLYWSYPECWIALPLFCMPRPVVKVLYQAYKIFFAHRKFVLQDRLQVWLGK